jgi:hypothetical protein
MACPDRVAACHRLQRQEPGGVTLDAGGACLEHYLSDSARKLGLAPVAIVESDAAEGYHARRVEDAHDEVSVVQAESSLK